MDTKHFAKSKSVVDYTQRLTHRQSKSKPPHIKKPKITQTPTPQQSFNSYDDDIQSDSTLDCIEVAPFRPSQNEPIVIDSDDDEPVVKKSIRPLTAVKLFKGLEDYSQEAFESVATAYSGALFKRLPTEIHQHISSYLPTARDVTKYSEICRDTSSAITDSVWRERFERTFDQIPGTTPKLLARKYKFRSSVNETWTCFDLGQYGIHITPEMRVTQAKNQKDCLEMLKTLILESNAQVTRDSKGYEIVDGLNLSFIRRMISAEGGGKFVDIIDAVLKTEGALDSWGRTKKLVTEKIKGSLLYVIQLILTPLSLHPDICNGKVSHFDVSQSQAYATSNTQPIFVGKVLQDINLLWLLHTINFFKFHFKTGHGEGIIAHDYAVIERDQYVQPWVGHIKTGTQPLSRFWKGAYTFMDDRDVLALRTNRNAPSHIFCDSTDHGDTFPEMEMFFDESKFPASRWPAMWERLLRSNAFVDPNAAPVTLSTRRNSPRKSKATSANEPPILSFYGFTRGSRKAHFYGRLHAMPNQQGFHGFQRLVLMKFYTDANGDYNPAQQFCYEGCVLPGGRIVVGRWWDAFGDPKMDNTASGPFLWWNLERSAAGITADMQTKSGNAAGDDTMAFFEDEVPKG